MREQRESEQLFRDRESALAVQKAGLEEQTRVTTIVAAVVKCFNPANVLKPNGSNLRQWERMLRLHASERFGNADFFSPEDNTNTNASEEKIVRGIINSSVHTNLTYNLLNLPSSAAVFDHLMMKFRIVNRAAQIQAWTTFINIDPAKHDTTTSLQGAFSDTGKSFCEQSLSLS
ncbi:uncharacterized protein VP01_2580g3 [Puccinia sorghi]|uniref:Uncharacterized protein n=1 Tax=Puccinia sorghi TaxID=27349 RepID=A0A0L6V5H0_9BASI|nr:uncharacterized protein VP01_2580g3 [Puccinia sorghi]